MTRSTPCVGGEPAGHAEDVALGIGDVFADEHDAVVGGEAGVEHAPHRLDHQHVARLGLGVRRAGGERGGEGLADGGDAGGLGAAAGGLGGFVDGGFGLGLDRVEVGSVHLLREAAAEVQDRVVVALARLQPRRLAVRPLVVGVGVVRQPLAAENQQRRAVGGAGVGDRVAEAVELGADVAGVEAVDRAAEELGSRPAGQVEEGLPAGRRADRVAVVGAVEEQREAVADGLGDGLEDLALLGGAVAEAAGDEARAPGPPEFLRDPDCLQRVVPRRHDHRQDVQPGVGVEAAHHPALRGVVRVGEQRVEDARERQAAGEQQGLVAVVDVQPVVLAQEQLQRRDALVPAVGHHEVGLAAGDQLPLPLLVGPGEGHPAVEAERTLAAAVPLLRLGRRHRSGRRGHGAGGGAGGIRGAAGYAVRPADGMMGIRGPWRFRAPAADGPRIRHERRLPPSCAASASPASAS